MPRNRTASISEHEMNDHEIAGISPSGELVFFDPDFGCYTNGETLREFGVENLLSSERHLLGVAA